MTMTDVGTLQAQWDGVIIRRMVHHLVLITECYVNPDCWEDALRSTGLWGRDDYIYHYNPRLRREVFVFRWGEERRVGPSTNVSTST